jgi:Fic family protein
MTAYAFITDVDTQWHSYQNEELSALVNVWQEQRQRLETADTYKQFMEQMRRQVAIETGVIERLYTLDRGVTRLLIEQGIDSALIPHNAQGRAPEEVIALIRDQKQAIDAVFDYVGSQRPLTVFFIKQLHQLLTRNQDTVEAIDMFGRLGQTPLIKGDWKIQPNNPTRPDGALHPYCPPEHVAAEMDRLIEMHQAHDNLSPEVSAAWLHHRFTQIHPFQDGNGRVARLIASLVLIKAGWFPLVILSQQHEQKSREEYITALEKADAGDLTPLVSFFAQAQKQAFIASLSLSHQILSEGRDVRTIILSGAEKLKQRAEQTRETRNRTAETHIAYLFDKTKQRLEAVAQELQTAINANALTLNVHLTHAEPQSERNYYYRNQIVETAKALGYFANLTNYRAWLHLSISARDEVESTCLLFSLHPLGRQPNGVAVVVACAYRRARSQDDETAVYGLTPLTDTPFTMTHETPTSALEARFTTWLEEALVAGLRFWEKTL